MNQYKTIKAYGRVLVLTGADRRASCELDGETMPEANFEGSGMALCGVLRKDESLEDFLIRKLKIRSDLMKKYFPSKKK